MAKKGIQGLASGRSDTYKVDPRLLTIKPGFNCRDFSDPANIEHVSTLAESIREVGVKEPLTVIMEGDTPVVTNGESRLRAVMMLIEQGVEIATVPVQTEPRHSSEADHIASQIVRNAGKPFTVMEQCRVFIRLSDLGWTPAEIGKRAGLTAERVQQIMSLNQASETVREKIQAGEVSPTLVQKAIAKEGPKAAEKTIVKAVERAKSEGKKKATPRHVEAVRHVQDTRPHPKSKSVPADPRLNFKELFQELLSYAIHEEVDEESEDGSVMVTLSLSAERLQQMKEAAKK